MLSIIAECLPTLLKTVQLSIYLVLRIDQERSLESVEIVFSNQSNAQEKSLKFYGASCSMLQIADIHITWNSACKRAGVEKFSAWKPQGHDWAH